MNAVLLAMLVTGHVQERPALPPLTEAQLKRLQQVVRTTQERGADLKKRLEAAQRHLAQEYAKFDMDASAVEKLHSEVLDFQRDLLRNYHQLQVELRSIVGAERFAVLRQRLERVLGVDGPKTPPPPK